MTKEEFGRNLRSRGAIKKGTAGSGLDDGADDSDSDIKVSLSSDSSWGSE